MEVFKEWRYQLIEVLVGEIDDFDDVESSSIKKRIDKTKSFIEQLFLLAISPFVLVKTKKPKGNFFINKKVMSVKKKNSTLKYIGSLHYIILIKILDIID